MVLDQWFPLKITYHKKAIQLIFLIVSVKTFFSEEELSREIFQKKCQKHLKLAGKVLISVNVRTIVENMSHVGVGHQIVNVANFVVYCIEILRGWLATHHNSDVISRNVKKVCCWEALGLQTLHFL